MGCKPQTEEAFHGCSVLLCSAGPILLQFYFSRNVIEVAGQRFTRRKGIGVVSTQGVLPDGERLMVERVSLLMIALLLVEFCQVMERLSYIGVSVFQRLFLDGEGALQE